MTTNRRDRRESRGRLRFSVTQHFNAGNEDERYLSIYSFSSQRGSIETKLITSFRSAKLVFFNYPILSAL